MDRPQPPPEAVLIRLVREAAGMKVPAAAKAAGISVARWSQVELGYETRGGQVKPVRNIPQGTIAHMAHAVGLDPDRLAAEGQRPDAAVVLREILRSEAAAQAAQAPGEPPADDPVRLLLPPDQYAALTPSMKARMREALENDAQTYADMLRPPA